VSKKSFKELSTKSKRFSKKVLNHVGINSDDGVMFQKRVVISNGLGDLSLHKIDILDYQVLHDSISFIRELFISKFSPNLPKNIDVKIDYHHGEPVFRLLISSSIFQKNIAKDKHFVDDIAFSFGTAIELYFAQKFIYSITYGGTFHLCADDVMFCPRRVLANTEPYDEVIELRVEMVSRIGLGISLLEEGSRFPGWHREYFTDDD
jgi:hypothetical protein